MQHDAESSSRKQKRFEEKHNEHVWIFIIEATTDASPNFHMVEINKEAHKEIHKDLKRFDRENVEIRMDFCRNLSPFIALKSLLMIRAANVRSFVSIEMSKSDRRPRSLPSTRMLAGLTAH